MLTLSLRSIALQFKIDPQDVKTSMGDMMASVRQKVERSSREGAHSEFLSRFPLLSPR